jgi:hypothetical protein
MWRSGKSRRALAYAMRCVFLEAHMPKATWTAWRQAPELEALHTRVERVMARSAKDTISDQLFEAAFQYCDHAATPRVRRIA